MADYAFPVTEALVDEGVIGKGAAEKVDAYLAALTTEALIRARVMSAMTELSLTQVERVLGEYSARGVLKADEMLECEECQTLNPFADVGDARRDGDEYPCDGCGCDVTRQEPEITFAYQLLDTPT